NSPDATVGRAVEVDLLAVRDQPTHRRPQVSLRARAHRLAPQWPSRRRPEAVAPVAAGDAMRRSGSFKQFAAEALNDRREGLEIRQPLAFIRNASLRSGLARCADKL